MNMDAWSHAMKLILSLLVTGAFFGVIYSLLYLQNDFPGGVREVLLVLVGVLAGAFKDCVGFWIGSSASSGKKDAMLADKLNHLEQR